MLLSLDAKLISGKERKVSVFGNMETDGLTSEYNFLRASSPTEMSS